MCKNDSVSKPCIYWPAARARRAWLRLKSSRPSKSACTTPKGLGPMARSKPTWPKHTGSRGRIPQCTLWYATAWAPNRSHPAGPIPKKPDEVSAFLTDLPTQLGAAAKTASERGYNQVRVFVQDESRIGLLPIVRHRITARGGSTHDQLRLSL